MCSLEVPANETVIAVNVGHNPSSGSISSLTFETDKGTAIEFKGTRPESDPRRSKVRDGEKIVGLQCSTHENSKELSSINFITWKPVKNSYKELTQKAVRTGMKMDDHDSYKELTQKAVRTGMKMDDQKIQLDRGSAPDKSV